MFGLTPIAGAAFAALTELDPQQESAVAFTGITIQSSGDGQPHENMPPFFVSNWIIKT